MEDAAMNGGAMEQIVGTIADRGEHGEPDQPEFDDGIGGFEVEQHHEGEEQAKAGEQEARRYGFFQIDVGQDAADEPRRRQRQQIARGHDVRSIGRRSGEARADRAPAQMCRKIRHVSPHLVSETCRNLGDSASLARLQAHVVHRKALTGGHRVRRVPAPLLEKRGKSVHTVDGNFIYP